MYVIDKFLYNVCNLNCIIVLVNVILLFVILKGSDRPTQKEINNLGIRDGVATEWHDLGVELLPDDLQVQLDIIGSNKSTNVKACSTQMFQYWLQVDTTASWNKLIDALREIKKYQLAETICRKVLQGNSAHSYKYGYIVVFMYVYNWC